MTAPKFDIEGNVDCCDLLLMKFKGRTMSAWMTTTVTVLTILSASVPFQATAQAMHDPQPIIAGETLTLHSAILNEDRRIMVHLPADYSFGSHRYPVIYVLDGELLFAHVSDIADYLATRGRIPASIVIGIVNTSRNRDLLTQATDTRALFDALPFQAGPAEQVRGSGGADLFLSSLTREMVPAIDARYRTANFRVLAGHSFAGFFATYVLVNQPDAFNAYLVASPALWWDDRALLRRASRALPMFGSQRWLYAGVGEEGPDMVGAFGDLKSILTLAAPVWLTWEAHILPDTPHVMTSHHIFYDGLQWLYRDYVLDERISLAGDIKRVERHFADASARYGIDLSPSEETIGHIGYTLLRSHQPELAVTAFRRNVVLHPTSPNAYDSLADGLEAVNQGRDALVARARAVAFATEQRDLRLADYTTNRNRLRDELQSQAPR